MENLKKATKNLSELIESFDKSGIPTNGLKEVLSQLHSAIIELD